MSCLLGNSHEKLKIIFCDWCSTEYFVSLYGIGKLPTSVVERVCLPNVAALPTARTSLDSMDSLTKHSICQLSFLAILKFASINEIVFGRIHFVIGTSH